MQSLSFRLQSVRYRLLLRIFSAQQLFQFRLELADIFEIAIHAGKPDVGDRIDIFQSRMISSPTSLVDRSRSGESTT